jgi:hypothetical protein
MVRASAVLRGFLVFMPAIVVYAQDVLSTIGITTVPLLIAGPYASISRAPFTTAARWSYYLHRTYHPQRLGILALETTLDHALRQPECWDRSPASYLTRYSRAFDRRLIRNTAEFGAGLLTGEDLRYQRQGTGRFQGRVWHAVSGAFMAHMRDGRARPAYTRFGASMIAEVGTAHWTGQHITSGWLAQALAEGALDQVETNLLDEFTPDLRRIGNRLRRGFAATIRGERLAPK